ncbi:sensor histidine kinase [Methylobacter sp.]|uniref:sensor histidine kinase n=1 Tax=Methylobacter sp. TaxID=2051955 RepID=UPI002FDD72D8
MKNSAFNCLPETVLNYAVNSMLLIGLLLISRSIMAHDNGICQLQAQEELALRSCMQVLDPHTGPSLLAIPDIATNTALADNLEAATGLWVKISVNNANETANRLMAFGIPDTFFLYLFKVRDDRLETLFSLDQQTTFTQRPVPNRFLYADVDLAAKTITTFYVYYRTHGKTPLHPVVLTAKKLAQLDTQNDVLNGIIFGVLLVLISVLFFNRQGIRHADSLNYALLIVFSLLFLSQIQGYNFQFLWPEQAVWNMLAPGVIAIGLLIAHALFSISFLQMRKRFRRFFYAFVIIISLAVLSLPFAAYEHFTEWNFILAVVYAAFAMAAGISAVRWQVPAAPLYLLGSISLIIFNVILMSLSILWRNPFPELSIFIYPKIAYMLEPIFFMIAVINQLQRLNEQKAELRVKRQAETELLIKAEQDRLAAVEEAKSHQLLLAAASHDLSQPLASIRFAMEALRAMEEGSPIAQHINTTLDYAQSLIKDLIRQAHQQEGKQSDSIVLFELFGQLQNEFEAAAVKKGLRLNHIGSDIELKGSALMLHRILSNLLSNAVRYSHKGRVVFGVRRRSQYIEIQVLDTGVGLFEADCRALTAPFQQGPNGDSAGYGLGLFIVKTLCHQCRYELQVASTLGKGSVFAIKIPIDNAIFYRQKQLAHENH